MVGKQNSPKVSIVVITYQHEKYITGCLDSLLGQKTNFDFEIILGEDGSKDKTREICEQYAERYPDVIKLKLRERKDVIYIDGKPTGRFNYFTGLSEAQGEFIALCEGDDHWVDENKLQKQYDFFQENPDFVLLGTNAVMMDQDLNPIGNRYGSFIPKEELLMEDFIRYRAILQTCTVMLRNDHNWNFPEWMKYYGGGDWNTFIWVTRKGGKANLMHEYSSAAHIIHPGGLYSGSGLYYRSYKKLQYYYQLYQNFPEHKKLIRSRIALFEYKCTRSAVKKLDIIRIIKHVWAFIKFSPWFRYKYISEAKSFSSAHA